MDQSSKSAIERLPLEIFQHILAALGDIFSLKAAALTCHCLYDALFSAEETITTTVLLDHLNSSLLHDATIARMSSSKQLWSKVDTLALLQEYFEPYQATLPKWKLSDALSMAALYDDVHYFAIDLCSKVLAKNSISGKPYISPVSPSLNEISRIERALYRYQIYCNLFGNPKKLPFDIGPEQMDVFFSHFAHWGNEQLACIDQYLFETLLPVVGVVYENDPDWVQQIAVTPTGVRPYVQTQLVHGLRHVRSLLEAETYETRRKLLSYSYYRPLNFEFLFESLQEGMWRFFTLPLSEFEPKDEEKYNPRPLMTDPDPGPEDVWRWAHQSERYATFAASVAQVPLRDWAYVMWDRERLDGWNVFGQPWEGLDHAEYRREKARRRVEEEVEWETRAKIMIGQGKMKGSIWL